MSKYLKMRLPYILWWLGIEVLALLFVFLYDINIIPFVHGSLILLVAVVIAFTIDYLHISKKHRMLIEGHIDDVEVTDFIEQDYQDLLIKEKTDSRIIKDESTSLYNDMIEYYTVWAHQIKTPLAGLDLTVQNIEDDKLRQTLSSELVRTNEYVDMVMGYLRLQSKDSDFVFEKTNLNSVISQEIKRMRTLFMNKKIGVSFDSEKSKDIYAVTDRRWLGFAISQILTNSVKYSNDGTISIRVFENFIEIEDQGIGIAPEDLPRIFEKGYTGYNGRSDKKSTGIGLYLVKKAMTSIGGDVEITSELGVGTKVKLIIKI